LPSNRRHIVTAPSDTVLEASAVALEAQAATIRSWKQGTTPPVTPPPATDGLTDLPNFKLARAEYFNTDCAAGHFLDAANYGKTWTAYPIDYLDTNGEPKSKGGNGTGSHYDPNRLSVVNGLLQIGVGPTSDGTYGGSSPYPINGADVDADLPPLLPRRRVHLEMTFDPEPGAPNVIRPAPSLARYPPHIGLDCGFCGVTIHEVSDIAGVEEFIYECLECHGFSRLAPGTVVDRAASGPPPDVDSSGVVGNDSGDSGADDDL
jgi:hypothetical protein